MVAGAKDELEARLQSYVGQQCGPSQEAPDPVNEAMIRHWCEAMGDDNPAYTDAEAAGASVHGGIVAPPTMLQAWVMRGFEMADPDRGNHNKQLELHRLLSDHGYVSVVATNCEQVYTRYLRPGDRVWATTVIESISEEKATALGVGYFINTRDLFVDQNGEEIGSMTFRVLKFKPQQQTQSVDVATAAPKPRRLRAPIGQDNGWWWEGVNDGKLLIQKCSSCKELRHPPRPMCGKCQSCDWEAVSARGQGSVYSYIVMHHPKFPGYDYPLICAVIELDEGTRLVSNIVGCDPAAVSIGMNVELVFEQVDEELKLPLFRPVG